MNIKFAKRVENIQSSAVRDILKVVNQHNIISFAGGLPSEEFFPLSDIEMAFTSTFETGHKSLQYGATEGYLPLREMIAKRMEKKGINCSVDSILVTTGSQQAIDLFSRTMLNPGDVVLTEDPTYLAANQVFGSYEANIISVQSDSEGMLPRDLEKKISIFSPKFIYVVPTFSNPTGKVWSLERRKSLLEIAKKNHVIILEDDPYSDLNFHSDEHIQPIASLDKEAAVVYTSTFSKTLSPALRTGWIQGPTEIINTMVQFKQAADLHTNSIAQQAIYHLLCDFDIDQHIHEITAIYKQRMEIMIDSLSSANIDGLEFVTPRGGMFLWLQLDPIINTTELLADAVQSGIAFVPGAPFYVTDSKHHSLRLNFTHSSPEKIKQGISILNEVIIRAMNNH